MVTQGNTAVIRPEPEVISAYGHGWRMLWKQFGWLLLILFISWVLSSIISGPAGILQGLDTDFSFVWSFFSFLYTVFVMWPVQYGTQYAFLKAVRGEKVEVVDMFAGFRVYWNAILATLIVAVVVVIGFIFLIIPGIYLLCKLAFVPYLVVDKKLNADEAFRTSWNMTNGYGWQVFLIGLLAIPIGIAGLIVFGVGVIISIMWVSAALASLYYAVDASRPAPPPAPPVTPAPPMP